MELRVKVRKVGNSFIVTIPELIIQEAKIKLGDELCVDLNNSQITMRKCNK